MTMLAVGTMVPMVDGVWIVTGRQFVALPEGQVEVYTLALGGWEIRLTRHEIEENRITMH